MTYRELIQGIVSDRSTSDALKKAVIAFNSRDPVDATNDAEQLYCLMCKRLEEMHR